MLSPSWGIIHRNIRATYSSKMPKTMRRVSKTMVIIVSLTMEVRIHSFPWIVIPRLAMSLANWLNSITSMLKKTFWIRIQLTLNKHLYSLEKHIKAKRCLLKKAKDRLKMIMVKNKGSRSIILELNLLKSLIISVKNLKISFQIVRKRLLN